MINLNVLRNIKGASLELGNISEEKKNALLQNICLSIWKNRKKIYAANIKDVAKIQSTKLSAAFVTRLILDEEKLKNIIIRLKNLQKIDGDTGKIIEEKVLDNGVILQKMKVSFGVIFVIYESRPEVTIDAAALCIKSGNAVILKAGKDAMCTNIILYDCIIDALKKSGISKDAIYYLGDINRKGIYALLKQKDFIDLVIVRGGYKMVKSVCERSKVPVLSHSAGGARIYVDESADLKMAKNIIINSKISSPATCNSLDTIVVHKKIAAEFMPMIIKELKRHSVKIYQKKVDNLWQKEFLDLEVAIKVVNNVDEAISFVGKFTKNHTEGIIATNNEVISKFTREIDAASIMVNCSTRLHDGGIYGLGTELGIATGKLHARGPVGLEELSTYKWVAYGSGQIRN